MSWDAVWEKIFSSRSWGKYPGEDLIRFVAKHFYKAADRSQIKILEIGSGPGANLWFMAREGFTVYGVEGSSTAVQQSLAYLDSNVPNWQGEVVQGDIVKLDYDDCLFDAVIDIEAVYCNSFDASKIIYQEALRVLKPGGYFYSRTFAKGTSGDETGETVSYNAYRPSEGTLVDVGLVRFTSREDIEPLFAGFEIVEVDQMVRTSNPGKLVKEWMITAKKPE